MLTCESHTLMLVSFEAEYSRPSPPHRTQLTASVWHDMLNRHCSVTCQEQQKPQCDLLEWHCSVARRWLKWQHLQEVRSARYGPRTLLSPS